MEIGSQMGRWMGCFRCQGVKILKDSTRKVVHVNCLPFRMGAQETTACTHGNPEARESVLATTNN